MLDDDHEPQAEELPAEVTDDQNEAVEAEEGQAPAADDTASGDEILLEIAEEPPEETPVIRTLRKQLREAQKELKAAKREQAAPAANDPGPRPKLEDFDYNEDRFAEGLTEWTAKKAMFRAEQDKAKATQDAIHADFQEAVSRFEESKAEFAAHDFDAVESSVREVLGVEKMTVLVDTSTDAAKVLYALGKNPAQMERLASIKNPFRFAAEIGRLEGKIRMKSSAPKPPAPEHRPANTSAAASPDKTLDRLREEARKTGDFTKVLAFRAQMKAK